MLAQQFGDGAVQLFRREVGQQGADVVVVVEDVVVGVVVVVLVVVVVSSSRPSSP